MTIDYTLKQGSHQSREAGMCAMEWVAYIAGEKHTDRPVCVSPVLKSFCISFNDALPNNKRQRLRPYLARCIGTTGDGLDEQRAWMATDWLVTEFTPAWLDLAGLHAHAQNLRALGRSITGAAVAGAAMPRIEGARAAARDAARDAGGAARAIAAWAAARDAAGATAAGAAAGAAARAIAAWDVARDAARAIAARDAAWAAAGAAAGAAAWDAAGDAAWDAAWDAAARDAGAAAWAAAGDAARDAAGAALAPTVALLQESAFALLDRMLPTEAVSVPEPFASELERLCAV